MGGGGYWHALPESSAGFAPGRGVSLGCPSRGLGQRLRRSGGDSAVPFRLLAGGGDGNATPAAAVVDDDGVPNEVVKELAQALVAQPKGGAEELAGGDAPGVVERLEEAGAEIGSDGGAVVGELEPRAAEIVQSEDDVERVWRGGGAVLDGDGELVLGATDVEGAIGPGVEISRAAEALPGLGSSRAVLASVVHDEDGDIVLALHLAKKGEESRDIASAVFVDAVEADERVEQEQARSCGVKSAPEPRAIALEIETEGRRGDDLDGEGAEVEIAVAAQAEEALLHSRGAILGEVEKDGAWIVDGEAAETRRRRGDGEGQIEREPTLATLGWSADDADAGASPEKLDEPLTVRGGVSEESGTDGGEDGGVFSRRHGLA